MSSHSATSNNLHRPSTASAGSWDAPDEDLGDFGSRSSSPATEARAPSSTPMVEAKVDVKRKGRATEEDKFVRRGSVGSSSRRL